ncbi:MAG: aspartate carbamoyltransferase regulatory subunit [Candidatus Nanohalarchaeota archaeon]|nr:MAG: aspartate carbamoyltransferase regulatory subunit [Candidatus Nanohaloarchaeota archaeon]
MRKIVMEEKKVRNIIDGTVIDHIKPNCAMKVLSVLRDIDHECIIVCINTDSKKHGRKDLIKIENKFLEEQEYNELALISPDATINIIKNGKRVSKEKVKTPKHIKGIGKCNNPRCVTNCQNMETEFDVISIKPTVLRCSYCESTAEYKG